MRYLLAALYLLKFYVPLTQFILQNSAFTTFAASLAEVSPATATLAGTGLVVPLVATLASVGLADLTIAAYLLLVGALNAALSKVAQFFVDRKALRAKS